MRFRSTADDYDRKHVFILEHDDRYALAACYLDLPCRASSNTAAMRWQSSNATVFRVSGALVSCAS